MRKILSMILCVLLAVGLLPLDSYAVGTYKVWVMPSTEKVLYEQAIPANIKTSMKLKMAKNEYESGQVIVSAVSGDITYLTASVSNLVSGSNVIPASDVKIYVQHYLSVTYPTTEHFAAGKYPDPIIPYQNYIQKHSKLSVPSGKNQGLWFTVKTGKQTAAGTYTGNITLTLDGVNKVVPIEVKVWNFALTDESHSMSSFAIWKDMMLDEHPGITLNSPEYWTLLENYYNFLLDYRLSAGKLPIPENDINTYVQKAAKYVNDPRVPSYNISYTKGDFDNGRAAQIVQGLRNAGLLTDKAFYYLGSEIDEPTPDRYPAVIDFSNKIKALDPNLRHVVTVDVVKSLMSSVNTFCPLFTNFTQDDYRQLAAYHASTTGKEPWWYGCLIPMHPYPTYHIDDYQLSPRVVSWMQKSLGIRGNLYWGVNVYKKYVNGQYVPRDVWNDPAATPGYNGDGFLVYPGTYFNINGPIGTIRLDAIRDGNEDYEYLWTLEQKINSAATSLGVSVKLSDIMEPLYNRIFNNINDYTKNPEVLDSVRDEVAAMIESLDKSPKALAVLGAVNTSNCQKAITVYAEQGTTVKVNGTVVNASGTVGNASKYNANIACVPGSNQVTLEYSKNGSTVSLVKNFTWKFDSTVAINNFDNTTELGKLSTQNGVSLSLATSYVTQGTNSLKAVIPAAVEYPGFYVNMDLGLNNMSKYVKMEMDIYNGGSANHNFYAKFFNTKGQVYDTKIGNLAPGKINHVSYNMPDIPSSFDKTCVNRILFWMDGKNPASMNLYMDKLFFTRSGLVKINSFESTADIQKFIVEGGMSLGLSNEAVTEGSHSAKAVMPAGNMYPGLRIYADSNFKNIYNFESLELDVYNNSTASKEFFVKVFNDKGQEFDKKAADLAPGKITHVSYKLSNVPATFDKSCISSVLFWLEGGLSQTTSIYIDNFAFQRKAPAELNDFEAAIDVQKFTVEYGAAVSLSNLHATKGTGSMKVALPIATEYPGFKTNIDATLKNLKEYSKLEMDVYNEGSISQEIFCKLFNDKGEVFDVKIADLPAGQTTHVVYNFSTVPATFDRSCVNSALFWTWGKNSTAVNLYIDNMKLQYN